MIDDFDKLKRKKVFNVCVNYSFGQDIACGICIKTTRSL